MQIEPKQRFPPVPASLGPVYAVPSSEEPPAFGPTTGRFFAEGEKHEANNWQDTILPFDDEPKEQKQSGSFDRVPRKKGTILAVMLFGICLGGGVGFGVGALVRGGREVETSTLDLARGGGLQPSEATVLPAVAEEAAASTELAFSPGPVALATPATSENDVANAGPEDPPAGATPALTGTSAAAAVPADRKPRVQEGRDPSQAAAAKPARRPRSALKVARQRAITPTMAEPMGEALAKSGTPETGDSSREEASDAFATGSLVPPRFGEPSIAPANTGTAAHEEAPPSPDELRVPASDKEAGLAPTVGSEPDPFQPGEAK